MSNRVHWDRDAFTDERFWRARQVMAMFIDAIRDGWVERLQPCGDPAVTPEHAALACATIDREWAVEWESRGIKDGTQQSSPEFSTRLAPAQQQALVEMLRTALGREGALAKLDVALPWIDGH